MPRYVAIHRKHARLELRHQPVGVSVGGDDHLFRGQDAPAGVNLIPVGLFCDAGDGRLLAQCCPVYVRHTRQPQYVFGWMEAAAVIIREAAEKNVAADLLTQFPRPDNLLGVA